MNTSPIEIAEGGVAGDGAPLLLIAGPDVIESEAQYARDYAPGHMWMEMLDGEHVSTDVAVVDGEAKWWRHVNGKALYEGRFTVAEALAQVALS